MNRPRHRRKSPLLWKMVGVASVINLVLWPLLIHEGVFAGIRREVLIPVTLIPVSPSRKLPDALRIVSRTPPVPPRVPSERQDPTPAPHRSPAVPPTPVAQNLTAALPVPKTSPKKPRLAAVTRAASADATGVIFGDPLLAPVPAIVPAVHSGARHPAPRTARPVQAKQAEAATPAHRANPMVSRVRLALAARIARAKQLEVEGHRVAELIAQQRAVREAALPPPSVPAVVTQEETVPPVIEKASAPHADRPPPRPHDVPAVVILRVNPTVPDALMKSTWHATFRGEFVVHRNGKATVRMVSSTGLPVLDRRAMEAAHRWKFQPARRDGTAVPSIQPFAFEYDVHPIR